MTYCNLTFISSSDPSCSFVDTIFILTSESSINSYSKSYEICKNTTIYTSEGQELQETESNYLEDIMPTLYNIVTEIRKIISIIPTK